MPRVDPFSGMRPERKVFKREYVDPDFPEEPITLFLRQADSVDWGKIGDLTTKMIEKYLTGNDADGSKPKPFPAVAGVPVEMSETLIANAATTTVMQKPEDKEDRYDFDETLGIAVKYAKAWRDIQREVRNLNKWGRPEELAEAGPAKNGSGPAGIGQSSVSPATNSDSIQSISSEPMPSSPASTTDWRRSAVQLEVETTPDRT